MLYIVPSRGRPHNIAELIEAWEATRTCAQLWVCVDNDDPEIEGYKALRNFPDWVRVFIGPRLRLGGTLNYYTFIALNDQSSPSIIGFMGDDHRPRTPGWDEKILSALQVAGGTGVFYGNDLIQGVNLATAVAISADIIETLGYMVPPGMTHLYLDNAWMEMGKAVGSLIYLPDVVIEHVHPIAGKVPWDEGYKEVNSGELYEVDQAMFHAWMTSDSWKQKLHHLKHGANA